MTVKIDWLGLRIGAYGAAAALAVLTLFFGGLMLLLQLDRCGNSLMSEVLSPDGKQKVSVFARNCSPTVTGSIQASILRTGQSIDDQEGTLLIAVPKNTLSSWASQTAAVDFVWVDEQSLIVRHASTLTLNKAVSKSHGVKVEYLAIAP
ncbi:MAG: hypothetical protein Q7J29_05345 [Stagnimonas sp.]|nr:hypothetical protein [Stagnimonas sp.]